MGVTSNTIDGQPGQGEGTGASGGAAGAGDGPLDLERSMISTKKPDGLVGTGRRLDAGRQAPEQKAVLGAGGESGGGLAEPKSAEDWASRGASGGEAGRPPVALGGSSAGQSDRMPAGGATVSNAPVTGPKAEPGQGREG